MSKDDNTASLLGDFLSYPSGKRIFFTSMVLLLYEITFDVAHGLFLSILSLSQSTSSGAGRLKNFFARRTALSEEVCDISDAICVEYHFLKLAFSI